MYFNFFKNLFTRNRNQHEYKHVEDLMSAPEEYLRELYKKRLQTNKKEPFLRYMKKYDNVLIADGTGNKTTYTLYGKLQGAKSVNDLTKTVDAIVVVNTVDGAATYNVIKNRYGNNN